MCAKYLLKCQDCGEYGLPNEKSQCIHCGGSLLNPRPAKFSLIDKYGKYRVAYFKEHFEQKFK